jgi:hypothetical protein
MPAPLHRCRDADSISSRTLPPAARYDRGMKRAIIVLSVLSIASLVLCTAALWTCAPNRTTWSAELVVPALREQFVEDMSRTYIRVRPGPRPGSLVVERPDPEYGQLFVPLPRGLGRVWLADALPKLLILPGMTIALAAIHLVRRYRLGRFLPVACAASVAGLLVWRAFGTPFTYHSMSAFGKGRMAWRWSGSYAYESYDLPVAGEQFPFWLAVEILSLVVAARLLWRWLSHRPTPGFCESCGYDLRATPDRCPECGTVPATSSPS